MIRTTKKLQVMHTKMAAEGRRRCCRERSERFGLSPKERSDVGRRFRDAERSEACRPNLIMVAAGRHWSPWRP